MAHRIIDRNCHRALGMGDGVMVPTGKCRVVHDMNTLQARDSPVHPDTIFLLDSIMVSDFAVSALQTHI